MRPPERSSARDEAIVAVLPAVRDVGWSRAALNSATERDLDLLFPGGTGDMIETYCDLADRWMEADAANAGIDGLRVPARIRAVIALRLERNRPYKEAVRRALGWLALPGNGSLAARCTARTADAMWHAAGDRSADFSWYTKRLTLGGVYGATLLRWIGDDGQDDEATLSFLDRRLDDSARIGRIRRSILRR